MIFFTHPSRICDAPPLSTCREGAGVSQKTNNAGMIKP